MNEARGTDGACVRLSEGGVRVSRGGEACTRWRTPAAGKSKPVTAAVRLGRDRTTLSVSVWVTFRLVCSAQGHLSRCRVCGTSFFVASEVCHTALSSFVGCITQRVQPSSALCAPAQRVVAGASRGDGGHPRSRGVRRQAASPLHPGEGPAGCARRRMGEPGAAAGYSGRASLGLLRAGRCVGDCASGLQERQALTSPHPSPRLTVG